MASSFAVFVDRLVRPKIRLAQRTHSAFHVCGLTGFGLAVVLSLALVLYQGLALWVMGAVILSAVATFFTLAMITKVILGEERLVYYHHEIAVMAVSALLLWGLGQPVLPYLDATILGVGAFLACGRVGCLMVGCCHGRPHAWGVCYGHEHAAVGFVPYLVGVRLFPVQAAESMWVLGVVIVGSLLVGSGLPPGSAFAWYIIAYDIGRFSLEFVRGDPKRAYRGGFSEGQWMSLLLMVGVVGVEMAGGLPFHAWHVAATVGMMLVMLVLTLHRQHRRVPTHRLLSARHVKEVAEALREAMDRATAESQVTVRPVSTSLGIRLSAGCIAGPSARVDHYTLSSESGTMDRETAGVLSALIGRLRRSSGEVDLVPGRPGVFHLVLDVGSADENADGEALASLGLGRHQDAEVEGAGGPGDCGELADSSGLVGAEDEGGLSFGLRLQRG